MNQEDEKVRCRNKRGGNEIKHKVEDEREKREQV